MDIMHWDTAVALTRTDSPHATVLTIPGHPMYVYCWHFRVPFLKISQLMENSEMMFFELSKTRRKVYKNSSPAKDYSSN